ncbi:ABC transporter permease [Microbacterium sp. NPDC057650]|uniref:ABC transporter permease n=1 Tax=unclassified Microbacterium TaxID=2609290 RepID=UPI00366AA415
MSVVSLTAVHAKYNLLETLRVPIAVIGSLAFPALATLFFVVPSTAVAENPEYATQAIISMSVFAVMVNGLFSFALTVAENRATPWDPYLRTLPAPGIVRVLAHVFSTGVLGLISLLPIILIGALFTSAEASALRVIAGLLAIVFAALPFMFIGICIGYAMSQKAAIAVVQIAMFVMAFAGGLFLPPIMFADWLDNLSKFFPSRQAREFVIWAVQGGELPWWSWAGILFWTVVFLVLALVLFRRDEGRRFR